jgi:hypothetical protein
MKKQEHCKYQCEETSNVEKDVNNHFDVSSKKTDEFQMAECFEHYTKLRKSEQFTQ